MINSDGGRDMNRQGLAIVNMLIYVVIFSILSGVVLGVLSSSTRNLEQHIRRVKGYYVAEAGTVFAIDQLRRNGTFPASFNVEWNYNLAGSPTVTKTMTFSNLSGAHPSGAMLINSSSDFTLNW
jgi:type II secretory pathway pseudopilin PulG